MQWLNVFQTAETGLQSKPPEIWCAARAPGVTLPKKRMANFNYKQQYGVVVICKDEAEQMAVYERLKAQGLTLKVVCV